MELADRLPAEHRDLLLSLALSVGERRAVDELFAPFASGVRSRVPFDFCSLLVVTADPEFIRVVGSFPDLPGGLPPATVAPATDLGAHLFGLDPTGVEYVPRASSVRESRVLVDGGFQRAWSAPLVAGGKGYGLLTVGRKAPDPYTTQELAFLREAGNLLAAAVRQDLELERARRSAARARMASDLLLGVQSGEAIQDLFQRVPTVLGDCLEADYIGLVLNEGAGFQVVAESPEGVHRNGPPSSEGDRQLRELAAAGDFIQFHRGHHAGAYDTLMRIGFERISLSFLRDGGDLLGALVLARRSSRKFDSDERAFIELLRSILAQALANQLRLSRTEAAAARARTLNEVALLLNDGEDIHVMFERLLALLDQSIEADYVGLLEVVDEIGTMRQVGARPELVRRCDERISSEESGLDLLTQHGLRMLQYSLTRFGDRSAFTRAMRSAGMRRAVTIVIHQGDDVLGLLSLARKNAARFSEDEEAFLKTLGAMLGQAMSSRNRLNAIQTESARNALLNEIGLLLNKGESLEAFYQILAERLQPAVPFASLILLVRTGEPDTFRVVQGKRNRSLKPDQIVSTEEFSPHILARFASGALFVEGDTEELGGALTLRARANGIMRGAAANILHDGETFGILLMGRHEPVPFTEEERLFFELLSALAGQAIANLQKVMDREGRAIRSRVLSDVSNLLQEGESLSDNFSRIAEALLQAEGFDFLAISVRDAATGEYVTTRSEELQFGGGPVPFDPRAIQIVLNSPQGILQLVTADGQTRLPEALHACGFPRAATAIIPGAAQPLGLVTIARRRNVPFTEDETSFIGLLGALLGQTLANYEKARARNAEAARNRVLSELALLVNNGEPIETHFSQLVALLVETNTVDFCALMAKKSDLSGFRLMRSQELAGDDGLPHPERLAQLRLNGIHSIQYGIEAAASGAPRAMFDAGIQRAASVLLVAGSSDEGLLTLGKREPAPFTPEEMTFFELVATLLAYAVANESRIAQSRAEADDQAIIAEAAGAVAREHDAVAILRGLRHAVSRFIPSPFMSFGYLEDGRLRFPSKGGENVFLPIGEDFRIALENGQQTVAPEEVGRGTPASAEEVRRIGIHSHLLTRAQSAGVATGVLVLGSRDPGFQPGAREEKLCRLIADIVGPAMVNARMVELERQSGEDHAIVAEASSAVARETTSAAIALSLQDAVERFVPDALVRFGYLEGDIVVFRSIDGRRDEQSMGPYYQEALVSGQSLVPAIEERAAAGETLTRTLRARLQSHIISRADSAGAIVGFLLIGSRDRSFAPGDRESRLCRMIADVVGPAMGNARAAEREREEAEDQAIIAEAAAAVARESSPAAIRRSLRGAVGRFIPAPYVTFGFLEADGIQFVTRAGTLEVEPIGEYFTRAFTEGQVMVPATAERVRAGEYLPDMVASGIQAHVLTTTSSGGSVVGLLLIGSRDEAFVPGAREARLCQLIADIVGPAMANARAAEREHAEAENQSLIAAAASALASGTGYEALEEGLARAIRQFIPGALVSVYFVEADELQRPGGQGGRFGAVAARALEEGQVFIRQPWPEMSEAGRRLLQANGVNQLVLTRMDAAGESHGVLALGLPDPATPIGERELGILRFIAAIAGPAFANARERVARMEETEDLRILAAAAAAAAKASDGRALVLGLAGPIKETVPGAKIDLFTVEAESGQGATTLFSLTTGRRLPAGPHIQGILETGEALVEQFAATPSPNADELKRLGVDGSFGLRLSSGGETLGVLWVASTVAGQQFTARQIRNCRSIADIAGPAMANLLESDRRRADAEEQSFLADVASAAAAATDEMELMKGLWAPFQRLLPSPRVGAFLVDGETVRVVGGPARSFSLGPQSRRTLEFGQVTGRVTDEEITGTSRFYAERLGIQAWVDTALASGSANLGYLFVGTRDATYEFTSRDKRLFRLVADIIGPAMANLGENARRKADAEEQRFLAEAAAVTARSADERSLVHGLVGPIKGTLPGAKVDVLIPEEGMLRSVITGDMLDYGVQFTAAFELGVSVARTPEEAFSEPNFRFRDSTGVFSAASFRLSSAGEPLGILWVGTTVAGQPLTDRQVRLYRLIADIVGPALANLRESRRRKEDAEEQRILADAAAAIAAGTGESDILLRLIAPIQSFVPRARVAFSYVENGEMWLFDGRHRRPIHDHTRRALEEGQAIGTFDVTQVTDPSRDLIAGIGVKRWVDTAAHSGGTAVGVLFVGTPLEGHEFSRRELGLLRVIADFAGPAMVNARDEARRQFEAEDERVLSDVASVAARANESSEIIDALPALLGSVVPQPLALYGIVEGDAITYRFTEPSIRTLIGGDTLSLPLGEVGNAARLFGQSVGSLAAGLKDRPYAALDLHEYVLSSYQSSGSPVGMLLIGTRDPDFHFSERLLNLLRRLAQIVGPAVESARAEAELARQAELYGLMLRSLSEGVVLADIDGRVVFANALGRQILQATDPAGGASSVDQIVQLLPEDSREGYLAAYERGEGSRNRTRLTVGGKDAWFDYELVPLNDPVMKVLLVAADVTADVEREAEQSRNRDQMEHAQRLAALGELIGGVAHELNNPLTAILGFAEVMALQPEAAPLSEDLAIIQKEALRARNIVRDLLFIARPGTSERSLVAVAELVGHIERLRRNAWSLQGIECEIEIEPGATVWGNEHQLTQVVLNLVTNSEHALQDRPQRKIRIQAKARGEKTEIVVSDTGAGMDDATRGRVFEPFFTTKQGLGTGLGLPLSYSIVQAHEGDIQLASAPGSGTRFTITLPRVSQIGGSGAITEPVADTGKARVLVVDDEPSLRKVCQRLIASMGHECMTAENSTVALELASEIDFDLVLCDYRLAVETADVVVSGLARVAPQLIARTVIATGATTDPGVVALTEQHALRLIAKPYGVEDLAAIIRKVT